MKIVSALSEVSDRYDALFVDLWGCVHDGVRVVPGANEALCAFRAKGGRVILVTNSPRPRAGVERQLDGFGVDRDAWDDIATSGDSARLALYRGAVGQRVWHVGYAGETDGGFFTPPGILDDPLPIERVALEEAEGIVCTGPFDALADPEALRPQLMQAREAGLKLLCANPDIVVDRGGVREWCAGAVAQLYTRMGGDSLYFGKPHAPIYDLARRRLARIAKIGDEAILAIGDGPQTDAAGAMAEGLDLMLVTGGLGATETGTPPLGDPDPAMLDAWLATERIAPDYAIGSLR
jgi:HAD superfamily hydrolase (TIGR01459 family)